LIGAFVVFVSVPLIVDALVPAAAPVIPTTDGADHEYVVFAGTISEPFDGDTANATPLQVVVVLFAITGVGFIVTVVENDEPVHKLVAGVTV
jgi:hypothetical protein